MLKAFQYGAKCGFRKTVIIGTDCLAMTAQDINVAFQKLSAYDCVIGPAKDGGYYLIGLNRPRPQLFENIPWSTGEVLSATLKLIEREQWQHVLLEELEDLDEVKNLTRSNGYGPL